MTCRIRVVEDCPRCGGEAVMLELERLSSIYARRQTRIESWQCDRCGTFRLRLVSDDREAWREEVG